MKNIHASEHVLRILWVVVLSVGAAYVKLARPDLLPTFLGVVSAGWVCTRIITEGVETFDTFVAWLGMTREEEEGKPYEEE